MQQNHMDKMMWSCLGQHLVCQRRSNPFHFFGEATSVKSCGSKRLNCGWGNWGYQHIKHQTWAPRLQQKGIEKPQSWIFFQQPIFRTRTSKCASRHNRVHFFNISTSKSAPRPTCFATFYFKMCFAPQRRAIFTFSSAQMSPHPPL